MLSEQPHRAVVIRIHLIHQRVRIFGKTCCENNQFKIIWHYFQEIVYTGSLLDIDAAHISFDVHWDYIVWIFYLVKLTVHKSFIQIKNQCF